MIDRERNLIEVHGQYLDYYLHEHRLSWELISIGWATDGVLLTVLFSSFSNSQSVTLSGLRTNIVGWLCFFIAFVNLVWWMALKRNELYKDTLAKRGEQIETALRELGVNIDVFRMRNRIRRGRHPKEEGKLPILKSYPSTTLSRYSFFALMLFWTVLGLHVLIL